MLKLVNKYVDVYSDNNRKVFEETGKIQRVIQKISDEVFFCDILFDDGIYSRMINIQDIREY